MSEGTLEQDFGRSERLMVRASEIMDCPRPSREDLVVALQLLREAWRLDHQAVLKDHRRVLATRRGRR